MAKRKTLEHLKVPELERCCAMVFVRDTLRYTGRGKSGFEMHYKRQRCIRRARFGSDYRWQHWYKPDLTNEQRGEYC